MRIPDLDLDLLRCFVTVAERGGFTAAGTALGLTQSAVSLKVKRLAETVRRRVFERSSRSVALTRDGETLLSYARRILVLNDEAVRRLAQRLAAVGGRRLDDASPHVDLRLVDGTRFHAVLAPLARPGTLISLRVPRPRGFTLEELGAAGFLTSDGAEVLRAVVSSRAAFVRSSRSTPSWSSSSCCGPRKPLARRTSWAGISRSVPSTFSKPLSPIRTSWRRSALARPSSSPSRSPRAPEMVTAPATRRAHGPRSARRASSPATLPPPRVAKPRRPTAAPARAPVVPTPTP